MSAPTIQPGTRCQCPEKHGMGVRVSHRNPEFMGGPCTRDAVRLVTVPFAVLEQFHYEHDVLPMCAPCAAYAEAKAGAK